jgi:hypothetical protein
LPPINSLPDKLCNTKIAYALPAANTSVLARLALAMPRIPSLGLRSQNAEDEWLLLSNPLYLMDFLDKPEFDERF